MYVVSECDGIKDKLRGWETNVTIFQYEEEFSSLKFVNWKPKGQMIQLHAINLALKC